MSSTGIVQLRLTRSVNCRRCSASADTTRCGSDPSDRLSEPILTACWFQWLSQSGGYFPCQPRYVSDAFLGEQWYPGHVGQPACPVKVCRSGGSYDRRTGSNVRYITTDASGPGEDPHAARGDRKFCLTHPEVSCVVLSQWDKAHFPGPARSWQAAVSCF